MQRSTVLSLFVAVVLVAALAGCLQLGSDANGDGLESGDDANESVTEADAAAEDEDEDANATANRTDGADAETPEISVDDENATATFLESTGPTENVTVSLEVAANGEERAEGLMYRESLPENHGMVFVYDEEGQRTFWMKNTLIPLDIIYLDANRTVLNVAEAEPQPNASDDDLERYPSDGPAQYVIELERGFAEEHGVEPGTEVVFHEELEVDDAS